MGPRVTWGLYSRLPPVGRRVGWAGPLEVRLCCHQPDDSVVLCRATVHRGLPGCAASSFSGRQDSRLHMCWGRGKGQPELLLSKALGLLDSIQQLLLQLFVALVWWQIQPVETVEKGEQGSQHREVRALTATGWGQKSSQTVARPQCQPARRQNRVPEGCAVSLDHEGVRGGRAAREMGNHRQGGLRTAALC